MTESFWVGILFCAAAGLLSPWIVLKKLGSVTQGFAHSSFGGLAISVLLIPPIGGLLGSAHFLINMIFVSLIVILVDRLQLGRQEKDDDTTLNILFAGSMAVGLFIASMKGSYVDFAGYLFGNILNIGPIDLWLGIVCVVGLTILSLVMKPVLLYWVFDERFLMERVAGARWLRLGFLLVVSWTVVFLTKILGIVLMGSMLLVPGALALLWVSQVELVLVLSLLFAVISFAIGFILSLTFDTPIGASVCLLHMVCYAVAKMIRRKV